LIVALSKPMSLGHGNPRIEVLNRPVMTVLFSVLPPAMRDAQEHSPL
jgi:hypothetical protein